MTFDLSDNASQVRTYFAAFSPTYSPAIPPAIPPASDPAAPAVHSAFAAAKPSSPSKRLNIFLALSISARFVALLQHFLHHLLDPFQL